MNETIKRRIEAIIGAEANARLVYAVMLSSNDTLEGISPAAFAREMRDAVEVVKEEPKRAEALAEVYGL